VDAAPHDPSALIRTKSTTQIHNNPFSYKDEAICVQLKIMHHIQQDKLWDAQES
jgi:hypothetical protein